MFFDPAWVSAWSGEPGRQWRRFVVLGFRRRMCRRPATVAEARPDTETPR